MTEKTLSILGVIKKKLDNLDRNTKSNFAPDLSSEFDYVVTAKKNSDASLNPDQSSANNGENNSSNNHNKDKKNNEFSLPKDQEDSKEKLYANDTEISENSSNETQASDVKKDGQLDIKLSNYDEELESIIEEYEDELSDADLDGGCIMNSIFNITLREVVKKDDNDLDGNNLSFSENNDTVGFDFNSVEVENKAQENFSSNSNLNNFNNDISSNSFKETNNEFSFDNDMREAEKKLFGNSSGIDQSQVSFQHVAFDSKVNNNKTSSTNDYLKFSNDLNFDNFNSQDSNHDDFLRTNLTLKDDKNNKNLSLSDNLSQDQNIKNDNSDLDFNLNFSHDNSLDFNFNDHNHHDQQSASLLISADESKKNSSDVNLNNLNDEQSPSQTSLVDENALKKQQIISEFEKDIIHESLKAEQQEKNTNNYNRMLSALKENANNIGGNLELISQITENKSNIKNLPNKNFNNNHDLSNLEFAESKIFNNNNIFDNNEISINSYANEDPKLSIAQNQFHNDIANTFNNDLSQNNLFNEPNQFGNNNQDSLNSSPILMQNIANPNFVNKENSQENLEKTNPQLENFINDLEHHADNDQNNLSQFISPQDNSQNNNFLNISNQQIIDPDSDKHHEVDQQTNHNQHNLQNTNLNYQPQFSKPIVNEDVIMQSATSVQQLINAKTLMSGINNFMQSPYPLEIAIQLMEPKLEQWLNENLSQIVEKVVRDEIKRIMPK